MAKNVIVRVFKDTSMINQHDGLERIARSKKVRLDALGAGEHVIFLNRQLNRIKMFSSNGILSYYRAPKGKLNLNMIELIPSCFNSETGMDWERADRLAVEKLLAKKQRAYGSLVNEEQTQ